MTRTGWPWAIVLAAGEGTRLRSLTTDERGRAVPKQFCSLRGNGTLLDAALERARGVVEPSRIVTIVAAEHRPFWERADTGPRGALVVQPQNRGTAAGLLLPLLHVLAHDPEATVVVLPSDHHVASEPTLQGALRLALRQAALEPEHVLLLGVAPEGPETEYGWIVCGYDTGVARPVERFVEKPAQALAERLYHGGALWNSFLLVARGSALLGLLERHAPDLVLALRPLVGQPDEARRLREAYEQLPTLDFSREVLQRAAHRLRVIEVPPCGWTDLGTPRRVAECLRLAPRSQASRAAAQPALVLARELARQGVLERAQAESPVRSLPGLAIVG